MLTLDGVLNVVEAPVPSSGSNVIVPGPVLVNGPPVLRTARTVRAVGTAKVNPGPDSVAPPPPGPSPWITFGPVPAERTMPLRELRVPPEGMVSVPAFWTTSALTKSDGPAVTVPA